MLRFVLAVVMLGAPRLAAQDPFAFTAVAIILGAVSFAAVIIPVCRATRINPIEAIRYE